MKSMRIGLSGSLPTLTAMTAVVALALIVSGVAKGQGVQVESGGSEVLNVPRALTAKWWQWALGIPEDRNPLVDTTGEFCAEGQSGKVWFLGGTLNESGVESRVCTIPAKKRILFPLVNVQVDELDTDFLVAICGTEVAADPSNRNLRACAQFVADQATAVTALVDGEDLATSSDIEDFRVLSPPFKFDLPENDVSGLGPANNVRSVADGFWVLLAPLSAGQHEIVLGGTFVFTENFAGDPLEFTFTTEVTYLLTVAE